MRSTINTLPIDEVLRVKLVSILDEFNSHRINPVKFEAIEEEVAATKESKVIKMETKKKRTSFLEKLFMTEYA